MEKIYALEEIKSRQRSRDINILQGDRNTAYFQVVANHRNRKKKIDCLQGPNGLVFDQKGKTDIALEYYKRLFAKDEPSGVALDNNSWDPQDKVSNEENNTLIAPFSEEEIKEVFSFAMLKEPQALMDSLFFSSINSRSWLKQI